MPLFVKSGLVEENAVGVLYYYGINLSSSTLKLKFRGLSGKIIMRLYSHTVSIFHAFG